MARFVVVRMRSEGRAHVLLLEQTAIESYDVETMTLRTVSGAEYDLSHADNNSAREEVLLYLGADETGAPRKGVVQRIQRS